MAGHDHTEQDCRAHAILVFSERELIAICHHQLPHRVSPTLLTPLLFNFFTSSPPISQTTRLPLRQKYIRGCILNLAQKNQPRHFTKPFCKVYTRVNNKLLIWPKLRHQLSHRCLKPCGLRVYIHCVTWPDVVEAERCSLS